MKYRTELYGTLRTRMSRKYTLNRSRNRSKYLGGLISLCCLLLTGCESLGSLFPLDDSELDTDTGPEESCAIRV